MSDFVGNDPLIYRKRIGENDRDNGIRTQRDDARVLDSEFFSAYFKGYPGLLKRTILG